ncbi:cadherin repeat domain-containing protein [Aliamphritea spongicola]|nr:cadherin repeat domain-containing protein [Aliamphritea spongicola]
MGNRQPECSGVDTLGNPLTLSITEGVAGAAVATLSAQDSDGAGDVSYAVNDDRFEIVDGVLKLKADQSLDYETESSVTVTVTVTDAGGLTDQQTLTIGVIDVDEMVPVSAIEDADTAENAVDENSAVGTGVGITASVTAGPDDTVTYSLMDDAGGRFAIDSESGEITVAGELDFEAASSHTVKILATGSNGTSSEENFTIAVNDVNEAPTLVVVPQGGRVTETFENGAAGWSNNKTTDGGDNFTTFLGRFGNQLGTNIWSGGPVGNDVVEKTFALAGDADKAVIEFDLYEIDSWDDEEFIIEVAGEGIRIPLSVHSDEAELSGTSGNVNWSFEPQGKALT